MYTCPIQMKDVRYNAINQSFEATITVHDNTILRSYACAIQAPITTSFEDAARGLSKQAIRRHQSRGGLFSEQSRPLPRTRAGRRGFDPIRWLEGLMHLPGQRAA